MAGEHGGVTTVVDRDDRVLISVPMVGFPPGFHLRPGDRVVLVNEANGPAVRPLVQSTVIDAPVETIMERGVVSTEGQSLVLEATTVFGQPTPAVRGAPGGCVVWVVDSELGEGPRRVIAVRPLSEGATNP